MEPDEIGQCVYVLFHKIWGRTLVGGQLRSKSWWENRLKALIERPAIQISSENLGNETSLRGAPIPYELEFGFPNAREDCADWLKENDGYGKVN